MKIIFLDIDWVLNNYSPESVTSWFDWDKVNILRNIIKETWAHIVISSDWKYLPLQLYDEWYLKWDLPPILSFTNQSDLKWNNWNFEKTREDEINLWLKNTILWNNKNIKYVVIDDMNLNIDNFFKTDIMEWLTPKLWNEIINLLNK